MSDVTRLLDAAAQGSDAAAQELLPLVYDELRKLAAQKMAHEVEGQTLQPTALVHEAWLRLVGNENQKRKWHGRAHFFGAAAEAMRRILIDRARSKSANRHGGGLERVVVDDVEITAPVEQSELFEGHESLDKFAALFAISKRSAKSPWHRAAALLAAAPLEKNPFVIRGQP